MFGTLKSVIAASGRQSFEQSSYEPVTSMDSGLCLEGGGVSRCVTDEMQERCGSGGFLCLKSIWGVVF